MIHLPERISRLNELAYDLWWSWTTDARNVFRRLDYPLWRLTAHNPVKMLQLISPEKSEGVWGFSPEPQPELIATYKTKGEAITLSKGLDRDRAVDESGNQLAVFGRLGARPFRLDEMQKLYLRNGKVYTVTNTAPGRPQ